MSDWAIVWIFAAFCCFAIALVMLRNLENDLRSLSKDLGDLARDMKKVADSWEEQNHE